MAAGCRHSRHVQRSSGTPFDDALLRLHNPSEKPFAPADSLVQQKHIRADICGVRDHACFRSQSSPNAVMAF
jgi:hypothetical protein